MNATVLRLACSSYIPSRQPCSLASNLAATKDCRNPGNEAETIHAVLAGSGLTHELVEIPKDLIAKLGFIKGLYAFIDSGLVDGACQVFSMTEERKERFYTSAAFTSFEYFTATTVPQVTDMGSVRNWFQFLTIFDWRLVATFLLIVLWVKLFENRIFSSQFSAKHWAIYKRLLRTWSFTYGFIGVTFGLFLGLYTSTLLSNLLIPSSTEMFRDLRELTQLIERAEISVYTPENTGWLQRLFSIQNCSVQTCRFKQAIQKNAIIEFDSSMSMTQAVNNAFQQGSSASVLYSSSTLQYLKRPYCEMTLVNLSELESARSKIVMLFNKNTSSIIMEKINKSIWRNQNIFGTISSKYRKLSNGRSVRCIRRQQTISDTNSIKFREIIGVLIFSATGFLISILVLILELVFRNVRKNKTHHFLYLVHSL